MLLGMNAFGLMALFTAGALAAFPQARVTPIRLDDLNHHYFRYHGKTTVLITSGEHYGAVINADFDDLKYLDTLQRDGLNYTRLFAGSYIEVPGKSFGIRKNTLAPLPGRLIVPWTVAASRGMRAAEIDSTSIDGTTNTLLDYTGSFRRQKSGELSSRSHSSLLNTATRNGP